MALKYCGQVGRSTETIIESDNPVCPSGLIEMKGERPTPEYVADANGNWIIPQLTNKELAEQAIKKRDELMEIAYRKLRLLDSKVKLANDIQDDTSLKRQLIEWEGYLVALSEIEQQSAFPEQINWPKIEDQNDY